jgi:hypothetical protein
MSDHILNNLRFHVVFLGFHANVLRYFEITANLSFHIQLINNNLLCEQERCTVRFERRGAYSLDHVQLSVRVVLMSSIFCIGAVLHKHRPQKFSTSHASSPVHRTDVALKLQP